MVSARFFRSLCCGAVAAAGCASPDDRPVAETAYRDSVVLEDPGPGATSKFLDPNLATVAALNAVPGMSDSVTLAVIAGRPYGSMLGVERVLARHLSPEWRDSVYARVWLPLDLNTASSDEIILIPGVDTRLRYELEEYRPYDGIEEFRRDIGAQLGPEETARLERYIILP